MLGRSMLIVGLGASLPMMAMAQLKMPKVFGDGMVLQRGAETPVFGRATAGERITVEFAGQSAVAVADASGAWKAKLRNLRAGGPHEMVVKGSRDELRFKDVLVGEVWIASGQSNMEWAANWFGNRRPNLGQTNFPNLRMIVIDRTVANSPQFDAGTPGWKVSSDELAYSASMVGFLYGRQLHQALKVPVGIIQSAWGGTPAESWASPEALKSDKASLPIYDRYQTAMKNLPAIMEDFRKRTAEWTEKIFLPDTENVGEKNGWHRSQFNHTDWRSIDLPAWFEAGRTPYDGATWVRKEFTLDKVPNGSLTLELGTIDDADVAYVNGVPVGSTTREVENSASILRRYTVPNYLLSAGKNVLAVRVFDHLGQGGFGGPAEVMRFTGEGGLTIPLKGTWKMAVEREVANRPEPDWNSRPQQPIGGNNPWTPAGLYHAMICPIAPYGVKGAIWYQGESNADRAVQYRTLFPAMIQSWRTLWGKPDLKFYFVQLANFMAPQTGPEESGWAELRDAQTATLSVPHTGMALAIDVGEANDIHPLNKFAVADRLGRIALNQTYRQNILFKGPSFAKMEVKEGKAILSFKDARGLKITNGAAPASFVIAGADRKWVMAEARIEGEKIVVWSASVPNPVAVRYAWANNPNANIANGEGLPMVPFRTDSWPMSTEGRG